MTCHIRRKMNGRAPNALGPNRDTVENLNQETVMNNEGKPNKISANGKEGTMMTSHRTEAEKKRGRAHHGVHHVVSFSASGIKPDAPLPNLLR